jgi:hypothetical protein
LSYFDIPIKRGQKQQEWKNKTYYGKWWAVEEFTLDMKDCLENTFFPRNGMIYRRR